MFVQVVKDDAITMVMMMNDEWWWWRMMMMKEEEEVGDRDNDCAENNYDYDDHIDNLGQFLISIWRPSLARALVGAMSVYNVYE